MEPKRDKNSYRSILKGSSIMGGVKLFQVLISLVRSKFVAMFLGPDGMGVSSLFNTSAETIQQIAGLGLPMAVVKETAQTEEDADSRRHTIAVARWMIHGCGLLGAAACVLLAPWLAELTFGSADYTWQFMLLGLVVFMMVEGTGMTAILQGLHRLKAISKATILGSAAGLVIGVPLYYLFGNKGIVPAMALMVMTTTLWLCRELHRALPEKPPSFSSLLHKPLARKLLAIGLVLMTASMLTTLCQYLLNVIIRAWGSLDDVGLYNAANSITLQYSALVVSAMSMDYLPRLAAVANNPREMSTLVNRQAEIVAFLIAPIAILVIVFAPLVIRILLTASFLSVIPLVRWMALGVILKVISFPLGYITFAKDNRKVVFWLEGIWLNILFLAMAVGGYLLFGLMGLGYAMVAENAIVIAVYMIVNFRLYRFRYTKAASRASAVAIIAGIAAFTATLLPETPWTYMLLGAIFIITAAWSYLHLRPLLKK